MKTASSTLHLRVAGAVSAAVWVYCAGAVLAAVPEQ